MKTAISLPDPLFEKAERAAARLKVSRSELYARALAAYLREHDGDQITRAIDGCLAGVRPDPALTRLGAASAGPDEGGFEDWVAPGRLAPKKRRGRRG